MEAVTFSLLDLIVRLLHGQVTVMSREEAAASLREKHPDAAAWLLETRTERLYRH